MTVHSFNRSSQSGQFVCSPEDMIGRVGRICPYGIPQLRPLQSIRILRDPYIARRSPEPLPLKVILRFLSSLVSSALCSSPCSSQAPLIAFFLLSHYIPGSVSSTLHVSPCLSFLSNATLFLPVLTIHFGSFSH
jgi:hypothetical protein